MNQLDGKSNSGIGRVLITGGAGFIGSHLAQSLVDRGITVTVLDNLSQQVHGADGRSSTAEAIRDCTRFLQGDVRDRQVVEEACADQDAVVHLAAETGTGQSMYEIERYVDVNVRGTSVVLDVLSAAKKKVRKLVVASSRAVYGEGSYRCDEHGIVYPESRRDEDLAAGDFEVKCPTCGENVVCVPTDETAKLHPSSVYGITKLSQEQLVMATGLAAGFPVTALRYQNVYGPGQSLSNPYTGILAIFSTRILNGNDVQIFEDGTESRDFVFVKDVVEATVRALENPAADHEIFGVGTGEPTSVVTVAETLRDAYERDSTIAVNGRYRLGDIRHNYADMTKIQSKLDFRPQWNFRRGIAEFVAWVQGQSVPEDVSNRSLAEMAAKGLYK
ncbi:MAG TPA: NAD-dependent epimerase/dehydratase family protein [Pirellulales bacterium]|jgi:dTDP-L-rhamnose 4-epimerase|nr:NAD-dependent epimerase/dehydratase family protein [Pirellulales bacterium]